MRWCLLPLALIMVGVLAGCPYDPDTELYVTHKPADADMVGLYLPTPDTVTMVKQAGYVAKPMSLQLNADGTFQVKNIPDWWLTDFGKPAGHFDTGGGTWRTVKDQDWWALELNFTDTKGFTPPEYNNLTMANISIIGQKAPYQIWLTIGDPDDGQSMKFRKATKPTGP